MSAGSARTDLTVIDDTGHQEVHTEPALQVENAMADVLDLERVNLFPTAPETTHGAEFTQQDLPPEPKSLEAIPFISSDTSPFEHDEIILLDQWVVSRFYDTEAEAKIGLNRLFAQTGINFAYGLTINRHAFRIGDFRYHRFYFSARVGLYAIEESLGEQKEPGQTLLAEVQDELDYQLSVHHAARTLDLNPSLTLGVGHFTALSIAAGLTLCVALHGIMQGWLLGA